MRKLLSLIFALSMIRTATADLIVYVQPVGSNSVNSGQSVNFDITLSMKPGSASFDLQTFSMFFDLHLVGQSAENSLPTGIGTISVSNYLTDFASVGSNPSFQQADDIRGLGLRPTFDFEVDAEKNSGTTTVPTNPTTLRLFTLSINTGSMAAGMYELSFIGDPSYVDPNDNSVTSLGFDPVTGSGDPGPYDSLLSIPNMPFTITAVPEPSSLILVVLGACSLLSRRRKPV